MASSAMDTSRIKVLSTWKQEIIRQNFNTSGNCDDSSNYIDSDRDSSFGSCDSDTPKIEKDASEMTITLKMAVLI